MIVFRYLAREVMLNALAVSSILLIIIMSGRFIRYLSRAAAGQMDSSALFEIIIYRLPGFMELILPLGLFLGFLLGYGRLYLENEMTVLEACGMSRKRLIAYSMGPAVVIAIAVGGLSLYVSPLGAYETNLVSDQQKNRSQFESLSPGRFQSQSGSKQVIYTDKVGDDDKLGLVFVADRNASNNRTQITVSNSGVIEKDVDRDQRFLVLEQGFRYEGKPGQADYRETAFARYGTEIEEYDQAIRFDKLETIPTAELWQSEDPKYQSQLHWRLSLPVLALVVTLLAVPLSRVNPRQGRFARLVPSILIYLVYISILSRVTSQVGEAQFGVWAIWSVHLGFALFAFNLIRFGDFWARLYNQIPMPTLRLPGVKKS